MKATEKTKAENLVIGDWVSYQDMANPQRFGVVYDIESGAGTFVMNFGAGGGLKPAGASYRIVFEDGKRSEVSESSLNGAGGWQYHPEREAADFDGVQALLNKTAVLKAKIEADRKAKAEAAAKEIAELPGKYPNLETIETASAKSRRGGVSTWGQGAKNIRTELKAAFPGVSFRVKSSSYSGGCAIDINWQDGPTEREVSSITSKYQYCDFDGMQDLETVRDENFTDVFGGAKYVMTSRHGTPDGKREAWKRAGFDPEILEFDEYGSLKNKYQDEYDLEAHLWKVFSYTSL